MDREHPAETGLCLVRPRPGPDPGGDEQPVEPDLLTVGQEHLATAQVKPGGRDPEPPARVDLAAAGQYRLPRRSLAHEDLLRQRRPVVREARLVPDHGQRPGEAAPAQRHAGPQASQGRPDDDDPPRAPERLPGAFPGGMRRRAARLADVLPASPDGRLDSDGLDRACRRGPHDPLPAARHPEGASYSNASSPRMVNTSGAAKAHCAYPWQRVRSTTTFTRVSLPPGSLLFQCDPGARDQTPHAGYTGRTGQEAGQDPRKSASSSPDLAGRAILDGKATGSSPG